MRSMVGMTLLVALGWLIVPACHASEGDKDTPKNARAPYVHSVVFYLKKDTPPATVEALIADCHQVLGKIPSVRGLWAGRPADKATPKFAVTDYQVGLLVLFDNYEGLKTYLDHPLHLKIVEMYTPHVERVLVYDFLNQSK